MQLRSLFKKGERLNESPQNVTPQQDKLRGRHFVSPKYHDKRKALRIGILGIHKGQQV